MNSPALTWLPRGDHVITWPTTRRGWRWRTNLPTSWPMHFYWPITLISIWMQHYTAND